MFAISDCTIAIIALLCTKQLTIQHRNDSLSQGQYQAQWRAKQEKVRHLKVKLPQGASIQHSAAARPA